jgi:hypothetical protein
VEDRYSFFMGSKRIVIVLYRVLEDRYLFLRDGGGSLSFCTGFWRIVVFFTRWKSVVIVF